MFTNSSKGEISTRKQNIGLQNLVLYAVGCQVQVAHFKLGAGTSVRRLWLGLLKVGSTGAQSQEFGRVVIQKKLNKIKDRTEIEFCSVFVPLFWPRPRSCEPLIYRLQLAVGKVAQVLSASVRVAGS